MNKRKSSKLWLIAAAILLAYFSYIAIDQEKVLNTKRVEMRNIQAKIGEEKKLGEELKQEKEALNSDDYIEKVAREKLGMVKYGERVFIDVNK